jgi:ankyrin repeat protein
MALLAGQAYPDARATGDRTPILAALMSSPGDTSGRARIAWQLAQITSDIDRALVAALASRQGRTALFLLDRGASPNAVDGTGHSALAAAATDPGLTYLQLLISRGADLALHGPEALRAAAHHGRIGAVRLLLDRGVPVDARDTAGATALLLAASTGATDVVELLLARGADGDAKDGSGKDAADYMTVLPRLYEMKIEQRAASRAHRPVDGLVEELETMETAHDAIRQLLGLD